MRIDLRAPVERQLTMQRFGPASTPSQRRVNDEQTHVNRYLRERVNNLASFLTRCVNANANACRVHAPAVRWMAVDPSRARAQGSVSCCFVSLVAPTKSVCAPRSRHRARASLAGYRFFRLRPGKRAADDHPCQVRRTKPRVLKQVTTAYRCCFNQSSTSRRAISLARP
jgi:hypothetical protein